MGFLLGVAGNGLLRLVIYTMMEAELLDSLGFMSVCLELFSVKR